MDEALTQIFEKVVDAIDATPTEADRIETLLLEDPVTFAGRYREHLTPKERALLGAPDLD